MCSFQQQRQIHLFVLEEAIFSSSDAFVRSEPSEAVAEIGERDESLVNQSARAREIALRTARG